MRGAVGARAQAAARQEGQCSSSGGTGECGAQQLLLMLAGDSRRAHRQLRYGSWHKCAQGLGSVLRTAEQTIISAPRTCATAGPLGPFHANLLRASKGMHPTTLLGPSKCTVMQADVGTHPECMHRSATACRCQHFGQHLLPLKEQLTRHAPEPSKPHMQLVLVRSMMLEAFAGLWRAACAGMCPFCVLPPQLVIFPGTAAAGRCAEASCNRAAQSCVACACAKQRESTEKVYEDVLARSTS